jgi:hypothetical protein
MTVSSALGRELTIPEIVLELAAYAKGLCPATTE